MTACRFRHVAYVQNLWPRLWSYLSTAPIRPVFLANEVHNRGLSNTLAGGELRGVSCIDLVCTMLGSR